MHKRTQTREQTLTVTALAFAGLAAAIAHSASTGLVRITLQSQRAKAGD
jgi:hypothetical protein